VIERARGRRRLGRGAGPFALLGAGALAVHLPVAAEPRMLVPVVPIVIWAAVCSRPVRTPRPAPFAWAALEREVTVSESEREREVEAVR